MKVRDLSIKDRISLVAVIVAVYVIAWVMAR
jgi:hypothetical protein